MMRALAGATVALLALGAPATGRIHRAAPPSVAAAAGPDSTGVAVAVPFAVGERMDYDVKFGPLKVGSARMEVGALDTVRGHNAWHTTFTVKGGTFFYHVNDRLESWFDTGSLASLRFHQLLSEGGTDRVHRFEIYPDRVTFSEDGRAAEPSVSRPLDDASFLYYVRTVALDVGHEYSFDRYFRPDRNPVRLIVLRKERVTVPAGTFDAIVVRPIIKTRGIFSEGGQAQIWITDDSARMIVQLKSRLSFGSLNLYLRQYQR
jgi:hypothetical protein